MTCNVKLEWRSKLPAITHLDGTARPQVLARSTNNKMYEILDEFSKLTGFHLLVNTSLNIHEEPINFTLEDSINALKDNAFDILVFEEYLIYGKNLQIHNT
jgi:carbamoyltransferase